MFNSILVVCTGNICRSPIGERLLRKELPAKMVNSAGTGALVGKPADETAIKISNEYGLSLSDHEAVQLTGEMVKRYDLILTMERYHIDYISRLYPESRGKILLYGHWLNQREIPDPYRKSEEAFLSVFQLLELASKEWAVKLSA